MQEMGVRQFKETLSKALQAVGRGETIRITYRGRALADVVPAGAPASDDRLRQLVALGRIMPPARGRPARAPRLVTASPPASELVLAERDDER